MSLEQEHDRREMSLRAKLSLPEAGPPPWSLAMALLSVGAMLLCLIIIGPTVASLRSPSQALTPATLTLSYAIGMTLTIVFALVSRRGSQSSWQALALSGGHLPASMALFIGIAIGLALDLLVSLLSGSFLPMPQIWGFREGGLAGVMLAASLLIIIQPLAETLIFQAILLPSLRWRLGPWRGLVITALIYALLHQLVFMAAYSHYHPLWHGLALPLGIGVLFSLLKVYAGSSRAALLGRVGAGLVFMLTALAISGG